MNPDGQEATLNLWTHYMRRGDFEVAWKMSDAVLRSCAGKLYRHLPRHFQCVWNGTPLEGKRVLVCCYHGLGDTIQFIRYIPLLKAIAREVLVWAPPSLIPLLQSVEGIDRLLPLHGGKPEVEFEAHIEIMELPYIFRTTLATIPSEVPYLQVEPMPLALKNGQLTVGLVWKAGDWDERRCIPFSCIASLAKVKDIRFYILQSGAALAGWPEGFGVYPGEFGLMEYARVIRAMDLVISVDSMPVHLAGALGVPVWNLLHAEADWRWMEGRDDSPWYPTMRLFRQECPGDWAAVIGRVTTELEKRVGADCQTASFAALT